MACDVCFVGDGAWLDVVRVTVYSIDGVTHCECQGKAMCYHLTAVHCDGHGHGRVTSEPVVVKDGGTVLL